MLEIKKFENIMLTPALPLLMEEFQVSLGYWPDRQEYNFSWDDTAFVLFKDNMPVGLITFKLNDWCKTCSLKVGYIKAEHRRKGYYKMLWTDLINYCKEKGMLVIESGVKKENPITHQLSKSFGREEFAIIYRYKIPGQEHK